MGIEPTAQAWEAWVLPLYDARSGRLGANSKRSYPAVQPRRPSIVHQTAVAATMKEQRPGVAVVSELQHFADEDQVIPTGVLMIVADFEVGAHPLQDRGAAVPGPPGQSGKAIGRPGREAVGEVFLVSRQNVDAVVARPTEALQEIGRYREAPEDQGRLQGDGGKRIHRQTHGLPIGAEGRDHGHAGGETAQSTPKSPAVESGGTRCGIAGASGRAGAVF